MTYKKYIEIMTKKDECIYSKLFNGLQISNLNMQELLIQFIIVFPLL